VRGGDVVLQGREFHSPTGSLGATAWVLVNGLGSIEVRGVRTGRHVDDTTVLIRLSPNGEVVNAAEDELTELLG